MSNKLYIIAGNFKEYEKYIYSNKLNPRNCINAYSIKVLRGIRIKYFVFYGTYHLRRDIEEIKNILKVSLFHESYNGRIMENFSTKAEKDVTGVRKNFHNLWENVFDFLQD
jgi:hypothetical protein